jgi:RNA polymerase sigma-70 factor (ECF subfamily)
VAIFSRLPSLPLGQGNSGPFVSSAFFRTDGDSLVAEEDAPAIDQRKVLEGLYPELAPSVTRFLRDLIGDATLAKDAAQETFVRAFRRVGELPRGSRLAPWVFGIARNVSLEVRKARGRVRKVMVDPGAEPRLDVPEPAARSPEAELLDREALQVVTRALERLSDDRRAALLLRLDHGLAYEDIAELMGWSLAKVKVEIFRAREVLRATLDEYRGGVA